MLEYTIVYGPAPPAHWKLLKDNPGNLLASNGLWQAILTISDALLVDSDTLPSEQQKGYMKAHWEDSLHIKKSTSLLVPPKPIKLGEHDIDTVIHVFFRYFGYPEVFEGLCNPPGGDWSGISLQTSDRVKTVRWLSLPRVSGEHAKRPDHIFQIYTEGEKPIVLIIESKDFAKRIEDHIGTRLKEYVNDLLSSVPSAEKNHQDGRWIQAKDHVSKEQFQMASATAFIMQNSSDIIKLQARAEVDLICGFKFNVTTNVCTINCHTCTELGQKIFNFMIKYQKNGAGIELKQV